MARAVVIQHLEPEGPAAIGEALRRHGLDVDVVRVDRGDPVPGDLSDVAALVIMGGPMSARSDDDYPTRRSELALVREAISRGTPMLGVCLGAQLLAAAAGGEVIDGHGPEIGWAPIELLDEADDDALLGGLRGSFDVLHWHGETYTLPPEATHLARSASYEQQAFRVGPMAWGFQFHLEVDAAAVGGFVDAFAEEADLAPGGRSGLVEDTPAALDQLAPIRDRVLDRFAALAALAARAAPVEPAAPDAPDAPDAPGGSYRTDRPVFEDRDGVTVLDQRWITERLVELRVDADSLVNPVGVRVLLPRSYDPGHSPGYRLLMLLHGGLGGFRDWTDQGDVQALTADAEVVVVMPYGGLGGWYRDWHNFGRGGVPRWETFHLRQLLPFIEGQLATRPERSGRAIAGLSMGGFGALSYAARNPELFAAAASFSGAVHTGFPLLQALICVSPRAQHRMPFAINRFPVIGRTDWHAHNPWNLADQLRDTHVALSTGNGRPTRWRRRGDTRPKDLQENQVRAMTLALHRRLDELGIDHTLRDYGDIGHTFDNWRQALADELPHLLAALTPNP